MGGIARRRFYCVTVHDRDRAFPGYNYFDPYFQQNRVYLMDMEGRFVHYWDMPGMFADWTELLPDGHVLAPVRKIVPDGPKFPGFCGATIYEVDWDGNVVWQYEDDFQHHAVKRLENGNTLILKVVETPPEIARRVRGGMPGTEDKGRMWADAIDEVTPEGEVVWQWLSYEHFDPKEDSICPYEERDEWTHGNNLEVYENGDILITFRLLHTCVIIDRQTGKLKWKWGRGEIWHPHHPTMLDNGNVLIFDNGVHRRDSYLEYSRLVEVDPRTNQIVWEYKGTPVTEFYSTFCGGAQRLPNGNTMTCEANMGRIFEVTHDGDIVWEYLSPFYSLNQDTGEDQRDFGHCPWIHRSARFPLDYDAFKDKDLDPDRHRALNALYGPDAFKGMAP